ncbi:MAG: hypothetical protein C0483_19865, partial [Pirellula sp.]|nr:hypothetical protein [Pirellula sp.]
LASMEVAMKQIAFAFLMLASAHCDFLAAADTRSVEPIPSKYEKATSLALYVESNQSQKLEEREIRIFKVRLINPTDTAISFEGYGEAGPWYDIQTWTDGQWKDYYVGWFCGTGLRKCVIRPGESSVIFVDIDTTRARFPVRVGVRYTLENGAKPAAQTVWSDRIEKNSTYVDPKPLPQPPTFKKRYPPPAR